jgi:hypothetical protein
MQYANSRTHEGVPVASLRFSAMLLLVIHLAQNSFSSTFRFHLLS